MFKNLVDPIVGLCQKMINGAKYIILDSAFYNQRGELVVPIEMCSTGKKIQYNYDRVLKDNGLILQKAKDDAINDHGRSFNKADTKRL